MGASIVQRLELEGAQPTWWRHRADRLGAPNHPGAVRRRGLRHSPSRPGRGSDVRAAAAAGPPPPFLFITAHGDIEQAVRLMRAGGADYLTKPFAIDVFLDRLGAIVRSPEDIQATGALGVSKAMRRVEDTLSRIATTDLPVLISGETGVGKEIAARLLHARSPRADEPFVAVNCAAIPATLLESELFGHEKGAFTGAVARKRGPFELAEGGTLFLDEIGDMPPALQAKLLRAARGRVLLRVGGADAGAVPTSRIVAATHQELDAPRPQADSVTTCFFRLTSVPLNPAAAERGEDVVRLCGAFLGPPSTSARACAGDRLDWPRVGRGAHLAGQRPRIAEPRGPRRRARQGADARPGGPLSEQFPSPHPRKGWRRCTRFATPRSDARILRAMEQTGGRVTAAARLLGVSRTTLWEKMQRLGI